MHLLLKTQQKNFLQQPKNKITFYNSQKHLNMTWFQNNEIWVGISFIQAIQSDKHQKPAYRLNWVQTKIWSWWNNNPFSDQGKISHFPAGAPNLLINMEVPNKLYNWEVTIQLPKLLKRTECARNSAGSNNHIIIQSEAHQEWPPGSKVMRTEISISDVTSNKSKELTTTNSRFPATFSAGRTPPEDRLQNRDLRNMARTSTATLGTGHTSSCHYQKMTQSKENNYCVSRAHSSGKTDQRLVLHVNISDIAWYSHQILQK